MEIAMPKQPVILKFSQSEKYSFVQSAQ